MTEKNLLTIKSEGTEVTVYVNPILNKDPAIRKTVMEFLMNKDFLALSFENAEKIMDGKND